MLWFQKQSSDTVIAGSLASSYGNGHTRLYPDFSSLSQSGNFRPLFSVQFLEFPPPDKPKTKIIIIASRQQIQIISQINFNGSSSSWLLVAKYRLPYGHLLLKFITVLLRGVKYFFPSLAFFLLSLRKHVWNIFSPLSFSFLNSGTVQHSLFLHWPFWPTLNFFSPVKEVYFVSLHYEYASSFLGPA